MKGKITCIQFSNCILKSPLFTFSYRSHHFGHLLKSLFIIFRSVWGSNNDECCSIIRNCCSGCHFHDEQVEYDEVFFHSKKRSDKMWEQSWRTVALTMHWRFDRWTVSLNLQICALTLRGFSSLAKNQFNILPRVRVRAREWSLLMSSV